MRYCPALLCLVSTCGLVSAEETFRYPVAKRGEAELRFINSIPVLTVQGTPAQMGTAVGALALKPGARLLDYPRDLLKLRGVDLLWNTFLGSGRTMSKQFPAPYQEEMEAMIKAAGADRDLVIAGNTFFDLKKVFACSAIAVGKDRSATGGPLLGRNLDYPSLGYVQHYSLVTVYRPKGKKAFASVGFPGLIGVLSGMNEDGLSLGVLEVFETKDGESSFDVKGIPYAFCLRQVLEEAATIDEAIKVLGKLRRTTTINVAIADRHGVAVLEVSPKRVIKRSSEADVCVTTNHFRSPELKADRLTNANRTLERFARLEELRKNKELVRPEDLRKQLDAVNLGSLTLQTMVFEPATLRLHLSIGSVPASSQPLKRVDLAELLRPKAGSRR
jgi:isopenicillin-N N-acyltransferase like protein